VDFRLRAADGVIEICGLSASTTYDNLEYTDGSGTVTVGSFTTDGSGCFQITGLAADSYSNFVITLVGCTGSDAGPIALNDPGSPTPTASVVSDPTACGAADGVIEICGLTPSTTYDNLEYTDGTGTVTVGSFTTDGSGCYQITGLVADSYSNFVVSLSGCTGSDPGPIVLTDPNPPFQSVSPVQDPTGCGATDGIIEFCGLDPNTTYDDLTYDDASGTVNYGSFTTDGAGCFQLTGLTAGTYSNFVITQSGCSATGAAPITLTDVGGPTVSISSSIDVSCFGGNDGEAVAGVSGGTSPYSYSWSPSGGNTDTASGLSAGTYTVTVTDDAGCTGSAIITIDEPDELIITETITDQDCALTNGAISLSVSGGTPGYSYVWTPNGETTSSITGITGGNYGVTVTDNNGCTATGNYSVNVVGNIPVTVIPNVASISSGQEVQLNASGATSYMWSPPDGLSCTDCPDPIASPSVTTTYIVVGTDDNGCTGSDTVTIYVTIECGDLFVPDIFSPNGDQENDFLCVYGSCITDINFSVYNRWGELVFETEETGLCGDETVSWDGNFKGKPAITGVYAYKLYVRLDNGDVVERSGNVTLVR
jgi:gliding motility-associated-like protein